MIKERVLHRSLRLMFSSSVAVGLGLLAQSVHAQETAAEDAPQQVQRVEITGSSIKRITKEGALPVQTLTQEDIAKTGATSVSDLIQALPAMQGFIPASSSVNGGGAGVETASIHGIGSGYTLVLLNGRRIAKSAIANNDYAVNLASIPLSAVERVEILTDGASALYGSDAIAGVVNFILKKNSTETTITGNFNAPLKAAGKSYNVGISKGFGDLEKDGYNVLLAYSHDEQQSLNATQRGFANSGIVPFSVGGQNYALYQLSNNTAPAGVTLLGKDGSTTQFSPDFLKNGVCGANTFQSGNYCKYNYASTVELIPKSTRDSFVVSSNWKLNSDTTLFAEAMLSKYSIFPQYAPPAQPLSLSLSSPLYAKYVTPYLAQLGVDPANVSSATMGLRLFDTGGRQDEYRTDALHLAFGVDGSFKGWDYNASYTHSQNRTYDNALGGYASNNTFQSIVASGAYDPFQPPGSSVSVLAPAVLHQTLDQATSKLDILNAHASHDLFKAPGGMAQIGLGVEATREAHTDSPSAILQSTNALQPDYTDSIIGGNAGALPFSANRMNYGSFAELLVPVTKTLDLTGALRYDSYEAAKNNNTFDDAGNPLGSSTQGNSASKATYKISARWQPVDSLLLRGSYGTGFKAPTLAQITSPVTFNGNTAGTYACPFSAPDPRAAGCQGVTQYDVLTGGNPLTGSSGLKPETSKQSTIGFRLEPTRNISIGFDLWQVSIKNQISVLQEAIAFNNPQTYSNLFTLFNDPISGSPTVAFSEVPINLASAKYQGIDWDHTFKTKSPIGDLSLQWTGTYMLKAEQDFPGTGVQSSLGKYGADQNVVFRVISRLAASWKQSDKFTHTLIANYRSGYHDETYTADDATVRIVNPDGSFGPYVAMPNHNVASYTTFDWQTKATLQKGLVVTAGIKNLFARTPPLSLVTAGGGNQVGYDARYTDPLGRQFYLTGSYTF
ncbi:tonB dependent receptor family protein [Collimonas arenae]|uniref:TonB dependent receptor family protein n=1 Tax=Collimonas arenae TaxID=279058 RepID=A0A127QKQ0_9BURK|nr:TonB-dependent receptor [Collimonas arenae]AMP00733.1 tonB dependent receptor family protein [Collimonas arenae]AMP10624.1 tonB dependent receptor family protein [Collimonas arenae]